LTAGRLAFRVTCTKSNITAVGKGEQNFVTYTHTFVDLDKCNKH
jgi:hypothetical protein